MLVVLELFSGGDSKVGLDKFSTRCGDGIGWLGGVNTEFGGTI